VKWKYPTAPFCIFQCNGYGFQRIFFVGIQNHPKAEYLVIPTFAYATAFYLLGKPLVLDSSCNKGLLASMPNHQAAPTM
jgi:hypothetical protein